MNINEIQGFKSFCNEIEKIGFCLSGSNGEGIFTLDDHYAEDIESHTGDRDKDPWAWRIRAVKETETISYGKVFFNKSGWITKDWLPSFISVRRKGKSLNELYNNGLIAQLDKSIYDFIQENVQSSLIDFLSEFGRENKKKIEKSLVNLQMALFITTCGETFKISNKGEPYGWPVSMFSTIEEKFGTEIPRLADSKEAYERLSHHIKVLNPQAEERKIKALIKPML